MTRDEVIALAREAEQYANTFCESIGDTEHNHWFDAYNERFAALVAAHEREECAKVCDKQADEDKWEGHYAHQCAAAIRSRT